MKGLRELFGRSRTVLRRLTISVSRPQPPSSERNPILSFTVGEEGRVSEARLLLSSGSRSLDGRILAWFRQLHFAPKEGCAIVWKGNGLINVEFGSGAG